MDRFVLVGTPNCGKTMLFNRLTGENFRVANFPGITVEQKEGKLLKGKGTLIDLPGTYSLVSLSEEERVAEGFLKKGDYDCIINILDGTCLEKSLPLCLQLISLGKPMVAAVNMTDLAEKRGIVTDFSLLSDLLGISVIPISAKKGTGLFQLILSAKTAAASENKPEKDPVKAAARISKAVTKEHGKETLSRRADKFLINSPFSLPVFLLIFFVVFSAVFSSPVSMAGSFLNDLFCTHIPLLIREFLNNSGAEDYLINFICNGIFSGVGTVLSFLPQISVLFALLTLLEDSGYMARASFIMHKPLSLTGLSGKSFLPLFTGFGCTTSALLSARVSGSGSQRLLTSLVLPFISCSARLPIYIMFAETFFPAHRKLFLLFMYLPGLLLGALTCRFLGVKERDCSFILELPDYRMPSLKNILRETKIRIWGFVSKAGTVILLSSALIFFLENTYFGGKSILSSLGDVFSLITAPLGFGFSSATSSLISGILAKEAVVSTLAVLCPGGIEGYFTKASALSFCTFAALYPPCISALSVMKKELGISPMIFSLAYQFLCAYLFSGGVYFIATVFGM